VLSACLLLGALSAPPARAFEPILMFLFGMAREVMYDAFLNSQKAPQPNSEPLPAVYPGTMVEPRKLRELIDESFYYLSERRREALFQAFNDELIKPKNATVRASMIQYFAEHAFAVRNVMDRLSKLTEPEMRALSEHFAAEARKLPVEDREKLRTVLEEGLLPVPPDLNRMLVVAVAEIPRPPPNEPIPVAQDGGAGKGAAKPKPRASKVAAESNDLDAVVVTRRDAPQAAEPPPRVRSTAAPRVPVMKPRASTAQVEAAAAPRNETATVW
jgi:hypothetical protein